MFGDLHDRKIGRRHYITYTKAGVRASWDGKVINLKFSSSQEVQWLKSLPAHR